MALTLAPPPRAMKKLPSSPFPDYTPFLIRRLRASLDLAFVASTHSKLLKSGGSSATLAANHLIGAYLRCQALPNAQKVLDEMPEPNVVSWTSLMTGYVNAGQPDRAVSLFHLMHDHQVLPNSFTLTTVIDACSRLADLKLGRQVHARVETFGLQPDLVVSTALINMYGKSNSITDARKVFNGMIDKNVISWGSMISAYTQNACGYEAIALFAEFLQEGLSLNLAPNHFMFSSVINACASLGRLGMGRSTHAAVIRHCYDGNDVIAGALIDMYGKCGCIDSSRKVFHGIACPSLFPFTSMIVTAAKYGLGEYSLDLFNEMVRQGVMPNSITLLGVLHACSHSGLVDTGLRYLNSMSSCYNITPSVKHYTCAVDMLGRAGRLDQAYEMLKEVQAEGDETLMLWSTLLSASRTHGRLDLAVEASKRLAGFDRDVAGAYVAMSNAYVSVGQWESAGKVWNEMRRRGIRKEPGCSWVEIKDTAYVFYAGKASAAGEREWEVMEILRELEERMRERGYVGGDNGWVSNEMVEVEGKRLMVRVHSEMLALGFGLIAAPPGVTIRVMKNLRMCKDCHEAFKLISDIVGREFVVRDLNRFHHFRHGFCTCRDYW
ncbi:pentatricopeptide repeat-containing protein At4g15720 [Elaeis guineensis]|uniref:Pentatricopeptide repeat-containing protein At4g15720 n=1 Tax=Elaeis guineensis var. tenera TaxID=51953 RepID=A0A6I9RSZ3_ELAGV|nr:pentatricopeptide repeat-containing protein At4g15720 [Elaeis guineensis]